MPVVVMTAWGSVDVAVEAMRRGARDFIQKNVRGAFTDARADRVGRFEMAHEGTLFLDEIANVPPSQQAKLLRVLETGEFERLGSSKTTSSPMSALVAEMMRTSSSVTTIASWRWRSRRLCPARQSRWPFCGPATTHPRSSGP